MSKEILTVGAKETLPPHGVGAQAVTKKNRGKARSCSQHLKTVNFMEPSEKVQVFNQVLDATGGQCELSRRPALL